MRGVLAGLSMMWIIIAVGYLIGHFGVLGSSAKAELTKFVYYVASPCLLFSVLVKADIRAVVGAPLIVAVVCGLGAALVYALVGMVLFTDRVAELVIGSMSAGLANAGYLGIPLAAYILGSAQHVTPVLLFQLGFFTPGFFVLADLSSGRAAASLKGALLVVVRNPLLMAASTGIVLNLLRFPVPGLVLEPIKVLSGAAVPCILVSFGMSLLDQGEESIRAAAPQIALATACKLVVQPVLAWVVGRFGLGLHGFGLFAVVTMAGLPTAQNAYIAASRARAGSGIARGTVLGTTVLVTPVLLIIAALLAHAL